MNGRNSRILKFEMLMENCDFLQEIWNFWQKNAEIWNAKILNSAKQTSPSRHQKPSRMRWKFWINLAHIIFIKKKINFVCVVLYDWINCSRSPAHCLVLFASFSLLTSVFLILQFCPLFSTLQWKHQTTLRWLLR